MNQPNVPGVQQSLFSDRGKLFNVIAPENLPTPRGPTLPPTETVSPLDALVPRQLPSLPGQLPLF